jgi:hypothetical protein
MKPTPEAQKCGHALFIAGLAMIVLSGCATGTQSANAAPANPSSSAAANVTVRNTDWMH